MGSFVTLNLQSLKSLLEACHNCLQGNRAQVCFGNRPSMPEMYGKAVDHSLSFLCCGATYSAEGAIFWHSQEITPDSITTINPHIPNTLSEKIDDGSALQVNEVENIIVKYEDDGRYNDFTEDSSSRLSLERDPLLPDEDSNDAEGWDTCATKSDKNEVRKTNNKKLIKLIGQQNFLSVSSISNSDSGSSKGKKYPESFTCEFCGKVFTGKERAYQFYYHRNREHTHEMVFKCEICSKEFWGDRELLAHRTKHKEQGYICHVCGQKFNANKNLKVHLLIHDQVRDHICQFCDKGFKRKDHLVVHERTHTGVRPYQCQFCDSAYPQKKQLKLHIKNCPLFKNAEVKIQ